MATELNLKDFDVVCGKKKVMMLLQHFTVFANIVSL